MQISTTTKPKKVYKLEDFKPGCIVRFNPPQGKRPFQYSMGVSDHPLLKGKFGEVLFIKPISEGFDKSRIYVQWPIGSIFYTHTGPGIAYNYMDELEILIATQICL